MNYLRPSIVLTLLTLLIFGGLYPLLIVGVGALTPHNAAGRPVERAGHIVGFENIGQPFDSERYFNSRPSAVSYNAASTGGSNQGPTNPAHIQAVKDRLDTLLAHNPGLKVSDIPADLVTASGGGLDPHISPAATRLQVARVAKARRLPETQVAALVDRQIEKPFLGVWGKERVNVLKLNLALDEVNK